MMELNPNYKSILELDKRLVDLNIEHELHRMDDGYIIYYPNHIDRIGDVIEHRFSHGHEVDRMEAYMFEECGDDVLEYLSVDEALELFINADKKRKGEKCGECLKLSCKRCPNTEVVVIQRFMDNHGHCIRKKKKIFKARLLTDSLFLRKE